MLYSSLCIILGGKGNAFAVIYPSEKTICIHDFENETFEMLLEESSELMNDRSSKTAELASKVDVGDRDPSSLDWDHIYEINDKKGSIKTGDIERKEVVKVVLYGVIGSTSFCQLHSLLTVRAKAGDVRYAARHAHPNMIATSQVHTLVCVRFLDCNFFF